MDKQETTNAESNGVHHIITGNYDNAITKYA